MPRHHSGGCRLEYRADWSKEGGKRLEKSFFFKYKFQTFPDSSSVQQAAATEPETASNVQWAQHDPGRCEAWSAQGRARSSYALAGNSGAGYWPARRGAEVGGRRRAEGRGDVPTGREREGQRERAQGSGLAQRLSSRRLTFSPVPWPFNTEKEY